MNVKSFHQLIRSDKSAWAYLKKYCWPDNEITCPKCGAANLYEIQNWRYKCSSCRYTFTDYSMRWVGMLRLKPQELLWLIKLFVMEQTAFQTSKELNIAYGTTLGAYS